MQEKDLYEMVFSFLNEQYVFRHIQLYDFFDNTEPIIKYTHVSNYNSEVDTVDEPCKLLDRRCFQYWNDYTKNSTKLLADEFIWKNLKLHSKRTLIKNAIAEIIANGDIVKTIKFNPFLKEIINSGRVKVSVSKSRFCSSHDRITMVRSGDQVFVCDKSLSPYIANPGYVISASVTGTYRIMQFLNLDNDSRPTNKLRINGWSFFTANKDEIGLTPEDAVMQPRY